MTFKILTAMIIKITVIWDVTPCSLEDKKVSNLSEEPAISIFIVDEWGWMFLWNPGSYVPNYTLFHPTWP
jgi:hypothetical protein